MIRVERLADGTWGAVVEVAVGVDSRLVTVPLGARSIQVDPGGMRNTPVVVATSVEARARAGAGASGAGGASVVDLDQGRAPLGERLLTAGAEGEVVLALVEPRDAGPLLVAVRALGGHPLPAVPLDDPERAAAMLDGCWVDVDVALPSSDGALRDEGRRAAETLRLFDAHHVVEVDPRPGLGPDESTSAASLELLAAAATGVLAGRIAAGNRGWR